MSEEEKIHQPTDQNLPSLEGSKTVAESLTENNQSTTNMEAHHPQHITHKKKWGEYLLEFFMLFFAVFLGLLQRIFKQISAYRFFLLLFALA